MKKVIYTLVLFSFVISCTSTKYKGLKDGIYAEIQTNKGNVLLELYAEDAPMTVANLIMDDFVR